MDEKYREGLAVRKEVLGEEYVRRALENATSFDEDFQEFVTRNAWGAVWTRPGLSAKTRSLLTITLLAALGHYQELKLHVRATRNTGATLDEVKEVLMQVGVYAGVPAAVSAFRVAKATFEEMANESGR
jgi:4-carboxymuconolactone decarboxylase